VLVSTLLPFLSQSQTILDRLLREGLDVPNSCCQGVCGACETRLIEGEADHRDSIFTAPERAANNTIFVCCSGAKSGTLTLDLCKRSEFLSITHKFNSDHDSQLYVGESRHSPPDHGVARWGIVGAIEIAA